MADSSTYIAFSPAASVTVAATPTSLTTPVPMGTYSNYSTVRIANLGTGVAFIRFGNDSTVTSDGNALALLPGVLEVFDVANSTTHFAVYAASGSQSINLTSGVGA